MSDYSQNNSVGDGPLPRSVRPRRWVATLLTIAIFVAGLLTGWGLTSIYDLSPHQRRDRVERITTELKKAMDLSDGQAAQVREIVIRRSEAIAEIRRQIRPQMERQSQILYEDVKSILTHEQVPKWDAKYAQLRERWQLQQPVTATAPASSQPAAQE